jgi:hypothetical protein
MAQIEKLTKEQEEYLPVFRQKYLDLALSPDRINPEKLQNAITAGYATIKKKPPTVLIGESPTHCLKILQSLRNGVVPHNGSELSITKYEKDTKYMWGKQDLYWIAFYRFGAYIGAKYAQDQLKLLDVAEEIASSCMWWWPYENYCVVSENPVKIKFDEQKRLHSENTLAVEFSDGSGVASWHGTSVPREWILDKKSLTPATALRWENAEQRRCACEILGWINVLEHPSLNPKVINADDPLIGTLIQVDLPGIPNQWFLKYQCGTGRWFAEAVEDKRFDTALKANAGKRGWRPEFESPPETFIAFIRT